MHSPGCGPGVEPGRRGGSHSGSGSVLPQGLRLRTASTWALEGRDPGACTLEGTAGGSLGDAGEKMVLVAFSESVPPFSEMCMVARTEPGWEGVPCGRLTLNGIRGDAEEWVGHVGPSSIPGGLWR